MSDIQSEISPLLCSVETWEGIRLVPKREKLDDGLGQRGRTFHSLCCARLDGCGPTMAVGRSGGKYPIKEGVFAKGYGYPGKPIVLEAQMCPSY